MEGGARLCRMRTTRRKEERVREQCSLTNSYTLPFLQKAKRCVHKRRPYAQRVLAKEKETERSKMRKASEAYSWLRNIKRNSNH